MKGKRFSVEQIVAVLKQAEMGVPVAEFDPSGRNHRTDVVSLEEAITSSDASRRSGCSSYCGWTRGICNASCTSISICVLRSTCS